MRIDVIKQAADDFEMLPEAAIKIRVRYLQSLLALWVDYIDEKINDIPESDVMTIIGELIMIQRHQDRIKSGKVLKGITDEMILQAREYPIDGVVEFHRGVSTAFCHTDKRPSLTWHKAKNRATCFPCGRSFSAIDVLMERDNYSFVDAVKSLAGGR